MGQIKSEQRIRNFKIAWIGTFMAGMAFSEAMPFLALYIMQISHFNQAQVSFYAGISYAASYLVVILVSPIWVKLQTNTGENQCYFAQPRGWGL
ncbi:hypothetical protein [Leuconostoc mesenteroides]|uniref:hypothetical protein n=1 Tax=Leuconostoc mesenteroides TaxID=1245 RepID=UPI0020788089|nr:hypothetical protein [Leuconostoc mesenteroides]USI45045.1 hypothetical protein M0D19_05965 [Leuconostoc mesenteroides]